MPTADVDENDSFLQSLIIIKTYIIAYIKLFVTFNFSLF